jgi:DNA-binding MarR family transcriptional regulator
MSQQPDAETLDFLFVQVARLHQARMHTLLETIGLYRGQPPMLYALWEQDGQTHSELAARLHIRPATMTKMVQRMEKTGFVERREDPADQRLSRVYLTAAGRAIRAEVERVRCTIEAETFAELSAEECALLRCCLQQMRANLKRAVGEHLPF